MKVLFTGLYPLYHYHFVSELNLLQSHILAGDEVWLATCDAGLMNCECNQKHDLAHCLRCIGIRNHGVSLLEGKVRTLQLVQEKVAIKLPPELPSEFSSLEELKGFKVEGFDLGMAVFSSLVDRLSDTNPDVVLHKALVRNLALDAWRVWVSAKAILSEQQFEKVYIFNGRYSAARPLVRACEQAGIDYITHEKSGHVERILLFENQFPHDPSQYAARIETFWSQCGKQEHVLLEGKEFFEERPRGQLSGWTSFITTQQQQLLPSSWDPSRRNIAVFATTDGEYVGLRDLYADGLYPDQCTAFGDIAREAQHRDKNIYFYIRLHPNSRHESVRWWESVCLSEASNVEIIPSDSPISSYALMAASEKCITFLSSVGIEATYWGKPSMILGKAFYSGIDAVYEPSTYLQAHEWVVGSPSCKPRLNAMKFGAFMRCGGTELPYSEPVNYYTLKFKGEVIEARQEVHEWLGECEQRKPVSGIKKWLQARRDKKRFNQIIKRCGGKLAISSQDA
jgi:hypothetical protein